MLDILCHVQSAEIDSDVYKWIGFGQGIKLIEFMETHETVHRAESLWRREKQNQVYTTPV